MKKELGIARCGLACCLCSENDKCTGCNTGSCPDKEWCENRKCSIEKGINHCFECGIFGGDEFGLENCRKGLLGKIKPYAFSLFIKRYGYDKLMECLERNENNGIVYHREGIVGDYDDFDEVEKLIKYIMCGEKE